MTDVSNTTTNKKKKKRFTKKRKERLVNMVIDSAAGSLLIQQELKQDKASSIPKSKKVEAILATLTYKVRGMWQQHLDYEIDKKRLIQRTADQLAEALREDGKEEFISKICYTISRAIKPIKGFASDRYIRKVLPAEYKDIEQRERAISGGTSSAATSSKVASSQEKYEEHQRLLQDKIALGHAEKGITDYTIEDLDTIQEAAILREIARHHMQKASYLEVELNALKEVREPLRQKQRRITKKT